MTASIFRPFSLGIITAALLSACSPSAQQSAAPAVSEPAAAVSENKRVAVTAIVEHPALDAVRQGLLEQLKAEGFEEGKNLTVDFQSAQGNPATAAQIAKKFVGDQPDLIVAIATPSAQAVAAATTDIPVVFAAVTDPVAAELVPSWEPSGTNITGVSDQLPLEPQIQLMRRLVPDLKSVGYVYSPGEVNSTVVRDQLKTELGKIGIELAEAPAQRTTDILTAARSLQGRSQLIYTSLDNNVVSSYESMHKAATEIKVPLLASDTDSVNRGAVAALGINYHSMGLEAGKVSARILRGEAPGSIAPQKMDRFDLFLSPKNAAEQGISLPEDLKQEAAKIVE